MNDIELKYYNPSPAIVFNDMIHKIEEVKGYNYRDMANKYGRDGVNPRAPYIDVWHWLLEHDFEGVTNGSYVILNIEYWLNKKEYEMIEEVRQVLTDIRDVCRDSPAYSTDGTINFWIEW